MAGAALPWTWKMEVGDLDTSGRAAALRALPLAGRGGRLGGAGGGFDGDGDDFD